MANHCDLCLNAAVNQGNLLRFQRCHRSFQGLLIFHDEKIARKTVPDIFNLVGPGCFRREFHRQNLSDPDQIGGILLAKRWRNPTISGVYGHCQVNAIEVNRRPTRSPSSPSVRRTRPAARKRTHGHETADSGRPVGDGARPGTNCRRCHGPTESVAVYMKGCDHV